MPRKSFIWLLIRLRTSYSFIFRGSFELVIDMLCQMVFVTVDKRRETRSNNVWPRAHLQEKTFNKIVVIFSTHTPTHSYFAAMMFGPAQGKTFNISKCPFYFLNISRTKFNISRSIFNNSRCIFNCIFNSIHIQSFEIYIHIAYSISPDTYSTILNIDLEILNLWLLTCVCVCVCVCVWLLTCSRAALEEDHMCLCLFMCM